MLQILFLSLLTFGLGCNSTKQASLNKNNPEGTWLPVSREMNGKAMPDACFAKQRLIIKAGSYVFNAESEDKGDLQYSGGKMDIYGKEGVNTGKHFTAIYKVENGQLIICYNLAGNGYPDAFGTRAKPLFFLSVYKRG